MHSNAGAFDRNTFINCPFDAEYGPLLRALLFTVLDCGLEPRITLEKPDSGQIRVAKILSLIEASRYSIHDISRLEPLSVGDLPRLNMAFELGLDLGCRAFGPAELSRKQCLILEREPYRYQRVLSDLSGNDIRAHSGDPHQLIREVRNWVKVATGRRVHAAAMISQRFTEFQSDLMSVLTRLGFSPEEIQSLEVAEFIEYAQEWIQDRES